MLSEMIQQAVSGEALFVSYRRAAKIGEDYTTVELGVVMPPGASDEAIAQALATGDKVYLALRDEVEGRMTQVLAAAGAPTETQLRGIGHALAKLGVPAEEHDEALGLLGGCPTTRRQAQGRLKRLAALQRNGHPAHLPKGWRWAKPKTRQASKGGKEAAPGGDLAAALGYKLPFGPQSHPDWKGQKLGDIAALADGPRFLDFLKETFEPATPEGEQLKAHAIALIEASKQPPAQAEPDQPASPPEQAGPNGKEGAAEPATPAKSDIPC